MGDCLATTDMGQKLRGCAPFGGSWVSIWAKAYLRTEWHLDPSSHLATIDKGQKLGAVPLLGGAGSPSNTKSPGWRPTSVASGILIHPAIWLQQTWAKNWGGALRERAGSPPNTMSSGPRSTFVPSGILMHPAIWPQETWAENLAGAVLHLLGGGSWLAWAQAYLHTKWHLNPSSCLATTDMGQKLGGCAPFGGELGSHLTKCGLD